MDLYSVGRNKKSICYYCKKSTPGCLFTSNQCLSESFLSPKHNIVFWFSHMSCD